METKRLRRHAHWDCSGLATGWSMFEACLDALQQLTQSDMDVLQPVLQALIPSFHGPSDDLILWILEQKKGILPDLSLANARNFFQQSQLQTDIAEKALQVLAHVGTVQGSSPTHVGPDQEFYMLLDKTYFSLCVLCVLRLWNKLKIQTVSLSPLPCQGASLETLKMLIGLPINPTVHLNDGQFITPTAAALWKVMLADSTVLSESPIMTLEAVGSWMTSNPDDGNPSLRILLGITPKDPTRNQGSVMTGWKTDRLIQMETNLDDISAEALAFAVEVLLRNGALDAWVVPIVMKKGRAAHTLHCLCRQDDDDEEWKKLLSLIFRHTTTLGVRIHRNVERAALHRKMVQVQTPYSTTRRVNVKLGYLEEEGGKVVRVNVKAEFDHCRDISLETGIPIPQIAAHAAQQAWTTEFENDNELNNHDST